MQRESSSEWGIGLKGEAEKLLIRWSYKIASFPLSIETSITVGQVDRAIYSVTAYDQVLFELQ